MDVHASRCNGLSTTGHFDFLLLRKPARGCHPGPPLCTPLDRQPPLRCNVKNGPHQCGPFHRKFQAALVLLFWAAFWLPADSASRVSFSSAAFSSARVACNSGTASV